MATIRQTVMGVTDMDRAYRLHLDLNPDNGDAKAEIDRLVSLGASIVDWDLYPADRDPDFVVLADPDGNRFCVIEVSKHV